MATETQSMVRSKELPSADNSIYRMAGNLDTGFGYIQKFVNGAWEIYEGNLPDDAQSAFPLKEEDFSPVYSGSSAEIKEERLLVVVRWFDVLMFSDTGAFVMRPVIKTRLETALIILKP